MLYALAAFAVTALVAYLIVNRFFRIAFLRDDRERTAAERLSIPWSLYVDDIMEGERTFFDYSCENVEIESFDRLKLRAVFVPHEKAVATVIMMHGYRSDGFADFSTVFEFYRSLGFNILLPHQRAHLTSEGKYITFGVNERYDCRSWAEYIDKRTGKDIWLLGVSMGAATVMMTAALDMPERVRGIIADCGFTSPWDELKFVLKRDYGLPPFPILYLVDMRFRRLTGYGLKDVSASDALKKAKTPVLFIHGDSDKFVPCFMTYENYDRCGAPKDIYVSSGSDHAVTSWADPKGYRNTVRRFILNARS